MTTRQQCVFVAGLAVSLLTSTEGLAQAAAAFTYDSEGRLTGTSYATGAYAIYAYDNADNITQVTTGAASPTARPDAANAVVPNTVPIMALANDTDPNSYPLTITSVDPGVHGHASLSSSSANNYVSYQAVSTGTDVLNYSISNGHGGTATSTITVTVTTSCTAPVPSASTTNVPYGSTNAPLNLAISGNPSSVHITTGPSHGTAAPAGSGIGINYSTSGFSGTDSLAYTATGCGSTSNPATATVNVAPFANPVTGIIIPYGVTKTIALNPSAGSTAVQIVSPLAQKGIATVNGAASASYAPNNGASGADSFYYTASNAGGTSPPAQVSLTIAPQLVASSNSSTFLRTYDSSNVLKVTNPTAGITITPSGGNGPYTCSWVETDNGDPSTIANAPSSCGPVYWSRGSVFSNGAHVSMWSGVVTDLNNQTASVTLRVTINQGNLD